MPCPADAFVVIVFVPNINGKSRTCNPLMVCLKACSWASFPITRVMRYVSGWGRHCHDCFLRNLWRDEWTLWNTPEKKHDILVSDIGLSCKRIHELT